MAQKYIIGDLVKYKVGGLEFIAEITWSMEIDSIKKID